MADSGETNDFENQIDRVVTDRLTATLNPHINDDDLSLKENLLDLRVSTASFDRLTLVQLLGGRELLPT